jgi:glycosyltransferase involved in cell wall biosynthesis
VARPDVVYLNRVEHLVWGLLASRAARAPLVCHLRHHPDFPAVGLVGRGVSRFIAVSAYMKRLWVSAGLRDDRVRVVSNGVDPDDYPFGGLADRARARLALGLPDTAFVVLCYGRLHPDKGMDVLLEAWRALALPPGDSILLVVGDPYPTAEGRAYAARVSRSSPDGVSFLPRHADVVPLLHAADVVAFPAQWQEPFGRVVAETLMTGRPVVATAVGGIPEQLTGEFTAFLVDPPGPGGAGRGPAAAALAGRLAELRHWRRDDPGLAGRCLRHARDRLSLDPTVDGIESVLREALGETLRAAPRRRPPIGPDAAERRG